jgi:tRNA A-37 threonylcarbamoyl transferase component Bud32
MSYIKHIKYTNRSIDRINLEIELQQIASKYKFCPKIINTTYDNVQCIIEMENLNEMCLADKYGDSAEHIPVEFWEQIRTILATLYEAEGIEYIDITPYNFIEKNNKVYIIDFGDAYYIKKDKPINWFLQEVLDGYNGWNPDFK